MKIGIHADAAPRVLGTYSHALQIGQQVFLSGQFGFDPQTMALVSAEFAPQLRQTFENLRAVARAAGGDLEHIVKLNVYLMDIADLAQVNEVMKEYFQEPYPARTSVAVAGLPKNARVEVEAVMVLAK